MANNAATQSRRGIFGEKARLRDGVEGECCSAASQSSVMAQQARRFGTAVAACVQRSDNTARPVSYTARMRPQLLAVELASSKALESTKNSCSR